MKLLRWIALGAAIAAARRAYKKSPKPGVAAPLNERDARVPASPDQRPRWRGDNRY